MAVKKTAKKKEESAVPAKVEAKETAPKKAPKKAAAAKAPAVEPPPAPVEVPPPAPTPEPAAKKAAPKKAAAKSAAPKKAAPAPIKLSASQGELLKKVGGAAEAGYTVEKKAEQRSIDVLLEKKLIKKGAKDKATGAIKYHISSAGKKHTS
jgi:hypothetical protein